MRIERQVSRLLILRKKTLGLAESCTGGLLADRLTDIPGSSKYLKWAIVAYSNESKIMLLRVPKAMIRRHGAVSSQVAVAMARGVRRLHDTDFGVGITGIAGPTGATKTKPVGLTYIAVCHNEESLCLEYRFKGSRRNIKYQAATQALQLISEFLM